MGIVDIDIKPVADVCNNLINKLSDAIGWVATQESNKKKAEQVFISDIENSDLSPFEKAALISNARKIVKEYKNFQGIVKIAMENINDSNNIYNVDNDWIMQFWNTCKSFSSEEFQLIWGRLLAQECNNPGSIPRSVIYVLQRMDKADAVAFMKFSSLVVNVCGEVTPMIFDEFYSDNKEYKNTELTFDDLCQLETLGLIKMEHGMFAGGFVVNIDHVENYTPFVRYHDKSVKIKDGVKQIAVGNVMFTRDGEALYKAVIPEQSRDFWENTVMKHIEGCIA